MNRLKTSRGDRIVIDRIESSLYNCEAFVVANVKYKNYKGGEKSEKKSELIGVK